MTQFPIKIIVTNVTHSWMEHLKDEWLPTWATVSTDEQTVAVIKNALNAAKANCFPGVVAPLFIEDFALAFTSCEDEPITVKGRFFTVTVTRQSMRIEVFDPMLELSTIRDTERLPAYIRIECSFSGLL